jgi:carbamoyl-phosphate synthase small subunit
MKSKRSPRCALHLSNGTVFEGDLIGHDAAVSGQVVFSTALVGYEQAMTDPSYHGQILMFTYPLIGNYGVAATTADPFQSVFESAKIQPAAVLVSEASFDGHHWTAKKTLDAWLRENGVPGISGLDTRDLVHHFRAEPNLLGKVVPEGKSAAEIDFYDPGDSNVLSNVSTREKNVIGKGHVRRGLIDCGVKWNIVRLLVQFGCEVQVLPWTIDPASVDCDGWVISNGPGNPRLTGDLVERIRHILDGKIPLLGICLGHQLLALAAGGDTEKMKYGHRSHNQPVIDKMTGRGYITSQNHGYVVVSDSLPREWKPWFVNANDGTVEGLIHDELPIRSIQFHPEASSGPRDTAWILREFVASLGSR